MKPIFLAISDISVSHSIIPLILNIGSMVAIQPLRLNYPVISGLLNNSDFYEYFVCTNFFLILQTQIPLGRSLPAFSPLLLEMLKNDFIPKKKLEEIQILEKIDLKQKMPKVIEKLVDKIIESNQKYDEPLILEFNKQCINDKTN